MMAFGLGEFDWSYYDGVYVPGRAEERAQKERELLQAAAEAKARRKRQRKPRAQDHSDASHASNPGSGSDVHVHHHRHHKKKDDEVAYPAHNGLPDEFLDARWSERFKRVLTRHYMYWGVASFRRGDEYDLLLSTRWLCLASRMLGIVLGASGAAFVYFADDGSCELLRSEDTCLASTMTSLPLTDKPMCQWVYAQEYCVFIEPETSALAVVVVAMFGALGNVLSAATEFGIRRLDEYVRLWLKHRVVEYDAEKKAATAYAMKIVGDFELGLAEEVRQERYARKLKNYEDNVEFDPDYDPRNEPAPWEPGGTGVQILIDFEIRKKKEAAELHARLEEEARLAAIEAKRTSLSREVDATCASAKEKELDPETDAAVTAARAALLAFNEATAASEEARALAIAEAAKPKPKWDYSVVVKDRNGTPSDTPSVNEDGDGDGEGVEVVVEEEMQVEEVKDEGEAPADFDGGGDGEGEGESGEESKKKERKAKMGKKEKSRKKKKKGKDKGPAPVGLPGDDDDDEEPDSDAPVVADTGMSYQALDPMFAKMAKKLHQSEFAKLGTTRYKWMIAAKLVKMQANIDYISSLSEAHSVENAKQFLLVHNSRALQPERATLFKRYEAIGVIERILIGWKLQLDVQGNATSAAQLLHAESLPLVLSKVRWSRSTASSLVEWMMQLPLASQRESFLMNMFLVRSLEGYQQRIAYRLMKMYVPGSVPDSLRHEPERFVHMFLFPLLCLPLCIACLVFMLPLGQRAVALWGTGLITGVIFDLFLFHPCMLWLKFIVAPSMARNEIVKLHGLLQYRARFLMTRIRGHMLSFSSLVQHFNPACRAARMVPDLHTSRLLIGLHDFDLSWPGFANGGRSVKYRTENRSMYVKKSIAPIPQTPVAIALHTLYCALHPHTYRRILLLALELALTVYSLLPDVVQDAMMEVGAVLLGGGVAISICYFENYRFLAVVGLLVLITFFLVVDMFIGDHTHHVVRSLRNHHYIRPHREGGDDGSSVGTKSKTSRSFAGGGSRRGALRRKSGAAVVPTNGTGDGDLPDDFTDISTSPRFNTDGSDEPSAALNGTSSVLSIDTGVSTRRKMPPPVRAMLNTTRLNKSVAGNDASTRTSSNEDDETIDSRLSAGAGGASGAGVGIGGTDGVVVSRTGGGSTLIPTLTGQGPFRQPREPKEPRPLGQLVQGQASHMSQLTSSLTEGPSGGASVGLNRASDLLSQTHMSQLSGSLTDVPGDADLDGNLFSPSRATSMDDLSFGPSGMAALSGVLQREAQAQAQAALQESIQDDRFHPMSQTNTASFLVGSATAMQLDNQQPQHQPWNPNTTSSRRAKEADRIQFEAAGPGVGNVTSFEHVEYDAIKSRLAHMHVTSADDHQEVMFDVVTGVNEPIGAHPSRIHDVGRRRDYNRGGSRVYGDGSGLAAGDVGGGGMQGDTDDVSYLSSLEHNTRASPGIRTTHFDTAGAGAGAAAGAGGGAGAGTGSYTVASIAQTQSASYRASPVELGALDSLAHAQQQQQQQQRQGQRRRQVGGRSHFPMIVD
jgi:hypothetical protein